MKAILSVPGLLGFLMLFARQCDQLSDGASKATRIHALDTLMVALLFLYTADVVTLIGQLVLQ